MPSSQQQIQRSRQAAVAVYALQACALFVGVTYFIGIAISYWQRRKTVGTWLQSHFRWQINTFWISLGLGLIGALTLRLGPLGTIILTGDLMWVVYRIVQGWTRLSTGQPIGRWPTPSH